jgi:hypothetical protein
VKLNTIYGPGIWKIFFRNVYKLASFSFAFFTVYFSPEVSLGYVAIGTFVAWSSKLSLNIGGDEFRPVSLCIYHSPLFRTCLPSPRNSFYTYAVLSSFLQSYCQVAEIYVKLLEKLLLPFSWKHLSKWLFFLSCDFKRELVDGAFHVDAMVRKDFWSEFYVIFTIFMVNSPCLVRNIEWD